MFWLRESNSSAWKLKFQRCREWTANALQFGRFEQGSDKICSLGGVRWRGSCSLPLCNTKMFLAGHVR